MRGFRRVLFFLSGLKRGQVGRWICLFFAAVVVIELLLLNIFAIYVYRSISSELAEISSPHKGATFFDKLQNNRKVHNLIVDAKANGLLVSLVQETLERLYITHEHSHQDGEGHKAVQDIKGRKMKDISFIGIDVSHSREATYIYNRILSRPDFPYRFMVVDIGTNDGFVSSNSFNFIQWGWDAVLVEPQPLELHMAQANVKNYIDKYSEGVQDVKFVQAVIGSKDGTVDFIITRDSQGAESHVKQPGYVKKDGDVLVTMPSITVKTLAAKNHIPKNFGLLSIDAEGMGAEILRQWLSLDFRPAYIIFEHLHRQEPLSVTTEYLKNHGYRYLGTRGWNLIFEHFPEDLRNEGP